jgi:hypothetical protein
MNTKTTDGHRFGFNETPCERCGMTVIAWEDDGRPCTGFMPDENRSRAATELDERDERGLRKETFP